MNLPSGLRLTSTTEFGDCLFSDRAFAPGDIVLTERPTLQWKFKDFDDIQGLITAYIDAGDEVQQEVDRFYCPPTDQEDISPLQTRRKWLVDSHYTSGKFNDLTPEKIYKLLLIADANAHVYCGNNHTGDDLSTAALFKFGAKVSHSCSPNLFYTSKVTGDLMYIATKPIEPNEMLSFSYIKCYEMSRHQRLKQLKNQKYFICHCTRCTSENDDTSGIYCTYVQASDTVCDGVMYETSVVGAWKCNSCSAECDSRTNEYLAEILEEITSIQSLIELWNGSTAMKNVDVWELLEMKQSVQEYLPKSHVLLIQLLLYIASICRTYYHNLRDAGVTATTPPEVYQDIINTKMTFTELKFKEIESTILALDSIESIVNNCTSPGSAIDYSNLVLWVSVDIIELLKKQEFEDSEQLNFLRQSFTTLGTRYYNNLVLTYGVHDFEVSCIRQYLDDLNLI